MDRREEAGYELSPVPKKQKILLNKVKLKKRLASNNNTKGTETEISLKDASTSVEDQSTATTNQTSSLHSTETQTAEGARNVSKGSQYSETLLEETLENSTEIQSRYFSDESTQYKKYAINYEPTPDISSPLKLEPVILVKEDVRELLEFAREKGLSSAPKWQRDGITAINQFLIHLEPLYEPLTRMESLLRSKILNSHGSHELLLFFYFWYIGLTIESIKPSPLDETGYLIYQIRTPIRRIIAINSQITTLIQQAMKKVGKRLKTLTHELDKSIYNDLLRLTPSSPDSTTANQEQGGGFQPVEAGEETCTITSISTYLLINWEGHLKTERVSELSNRGKTYVIQGILHPIHQLLSEVLTKSQYILTLLHSDPIGKDLKNSIRGLVKELKKMRKENGLKHVNASRNFSNSMKILEAEILRIGKLFRDVYLGARFVHDAGRMCLEQSKVWVPQDYHHEITSGNSESSRTLGMFKDCFRREVKEDEDESIKTFHEFFGTDDFKDISSSYQIRIPMSKKRMEVLFPSSSQKEESVAEGIIIESDEGDDSGDENQSPFHTLPPQLLIEKLNKL